MSRWADARARRRADRWERRGEDAYFAGDLAAAEKHFADASALRRQLFGERAEAVASSLNWLGRVAQDRGDPDAAERLFAGALAAADDDRSPEAGNAWNNLGRLAFAQGRLDEAVERYGRARAALEASRVDGDPRGAVAVVLNNLGTVHQAAGNLDDALACYTEALSVARSGNPGLAITATNNIGGVHHLRGELDAAAEDYSAAIEAARVGALPAAGGVALGNLGHVRLDQGDLVGAVTCYEGALAVTTAVAGATSATAADQHANLARAHLARGDVQRAAEYAHRALAIDTEGAPDSAGHARDLHVLVEIATATGDLGEALRLARRALQIHERIAPGSIGVANSLNNVGLVHHDRGELRRALDLYERALAILDVVAPNALDTATVRNNAGAVLRVLGDDRGALALYRRALEIDRAVAPHSPRTAVDLSNVGTLRFHTGDVQEGLALLTEAAELDLRAAPGSLAAAAALANLAWVQLSTGDVAAAESSVGRALAIDEALAPRSDRIVNDLTVMADVHRRRGRPDDELRCLRRAAEVVEDLRWRTGVTPQAREQALAERYHALHRLVTTLLAVRDPARRGDHVREAFEVADRARGRVAAEMIAESGPTAAARPDDPLPALRATERRLRAELGATYRRTPDPAPAVLQDRHRLEDALEEVGEQMHARRVRGPDVRRPGPVTLPELQDVVREDEDVLAFTVTDEAAVAWRVRRAVVDVRVLPLTRAEIDVLVTAARDQIERSDDGDDPLPAVAALARAVLWPLLARPLSARTSVIPDGSLALVPWDALPVPDGDLVVDRTVVATAPSAGVLVALRRRPPPGAGRPAFAGFSAPDDALGTPVPATRTEVRRIAALFPADHPGDVVTYLGDDATRKAVVDAAPGRRYLHFATHGILNDVNPLYSGLVVAAEPPAGGDLLAAHELLGLALDADVVTCSACESGLGPVRPGEGLVGLSRVLLAAGARAVVLTLAPVRDTTTARLMPRFYAHLLGGLPPAEALTAAKRELRRTKPSFAVRSTWAPFVVVG